MRESLRTACWLWLAMFAVLFVTASTEIEQRRSLACAFGPLLLLVGIGWVERRELRGWPSKRVHDEVHGRDGGED